VNPIEFYPVSSAPNLITIWVFAFLSLLYFLSFLSFPSSPFDTSYSALCCRRLLIPSLFFFGPFESLFGRLAAHIPSFSPCKLYSPLLPLPFSLPILRAATQPPQGNLKDRIAALQQRNGTPSPTSSPTPHSRDASVTPPRGSLRDKIAKFERKGGVPIPRGSFAMGAPMPEDPSTKSRELYGNRVTALGKGRPTAPGNPGHRSVTSPAPISTTPNAQISANDDTESSARLISDSTSHTIPSPTPPERRSLSGPIERSDEEQEDTAEQTSCHQEISIQLDAVSQPRVLTETDSGSSDPVITTVKTVECTVSPLNTSSAGPAVTTLSPGETPERVPSPQRPVSSPHVENLDLSASHKGQITPSSVESHQERLPTAEPATSAVETRITVEQAPRKAAAISPRGSQLNRSIQNDSLTAPLDHSTTPAVPQLSLSSKADQTEKSKASTTPSASNIKKTKADAHVDSVLTSNVAFPSSTSVSAHSDIDDSTAMLPPAPDTGRRSFSAVVHRSDTDKRPDSRHSTTSGTSTITSRPSSSSFKTGTDGGVVRSKRNFKHLGAVTPDPPATPGIGDLTDLLQNAAWLEERLSDSNTIFDVPSTLGEEGQKVESRPGPLSSTAAKTEKATQPLPAAATRSKGRGLTLGPLISKPSVKAPQSPVRSSTSTPSFQVHSAASASPEEVLPTPPKSTRRKYFSLRGALRNSRLSMSSEMSSDDSAPVATPPSPTFDFSTPQSAQGHGNDSMSVRSMFSIRSNKSGKSESVHGSLRLSPRRSVARASSFAERLLNRATKSKSLLDDPGERFC
jgi:hypothetical protein